MKQKTFTTEGLKYLTFAFATLVIWQLVALILDLYPGIDKGHVGAVFQIAIVALSWIFFFWGLFVLWKGRTEIGKEHVEMIEKGIWLVIVFLAISSFISLSMRSASYQISFFVLNLMAFLVTLYLLHALTTRKIKNLVWAAISIFIISDLLITIFSSIPKYSYLNFFRIPTFIIPYTLIMICYYRAYKITREKSK